MFTLELCVFTLEQCVFTFEQCMFTLEKCVYIGAVCVYIGAVCFSSLLVTVTSSQSAFRFICQYQLLDLPVNISF